MQHVWLSFTFLFAVTATKSVEQSANKPLEPYNPAPHLNLTGPLAPNSYLCAAEKWLEGLISGPETLVHKDGFLYTGLNGGHVVRIDRQGNINPIARFGKSCDGDWNEEDCGRPTGLKFDSNGLLVVADTYKGIFRVNTNTGEVEQLVSLDDPIAGVKPGLLNALEISSQDIIFWSDSTTLTKFRHSMIEFLADASGRVLRYNPKLKNNEILLKELRFPNGLILSPNEEYLLIAETARNRIMRYYLEGPQRGQIDIFIDGLPGSPDNLHPSPSGGYLAALFTTTEPEKPNLIELLAPYVSVRQLLVTGVRSMQNILMILNKGVPLTTVKRLTHVLSHFETGTRETLPRSIVIELDLNGQITNSLHCPSGQVQFISDAVHIGDHYYLGSPFNNYIGRLAVDSVHK